MKEPETQPRRARRLRAVPPPDSEIWPEEYRGKRWKRAYAILFAGCCQLCAHACPLSKWRQGMDKCTGLPRLLLCANRPDSPGELLEVLPTETCRNFRPKRWKSAASKQAELGNGAADPAVESDPAVRRIPLGHGVFATVDAADYEELKKYKWHATRHGRYAYATRRKRGKMVYMHREIMNAPEGYVVDHIDHDKVNNRRSNLRVCTRQQNQANQGPRGGSSRFVGVARCGNKWTAQITYRGENLHLGRFDDEVEAAKARDRKAVELHGPYAYLNFPEDWTFDENGVGHPVEPTPEATEPPATS